MHPLLIKIISCVLLHQASAENKSFKNVTINWNSAVTTAVESSDSLKENVPKNLEGELSATITGAVPVLYKNSISDIDNLNSLHLVRVDLQEIQPEAFKNLPTLSYLILRSNKLSELKPGTFRHLNLTTLDLGANSITVLHPGAFKETEIGHMALSDNQITEIPTGVFDNVTLTSLNLYGNKIETIQPEAFAGISDLGSLILSSNKLKEINPIAFDLPKLTDLDLSFNAIKVLRPGDLKNLPILRSLELVANELEEIPEGVFNQSKLTHLKLNYNKVSAIASKAFDDMSELSVLHIDNNTLTKWDNNWLHNVSQLAYIFAGENLFEEVPDKAFKNYPRMYAIDLKRNKIKRMSLEAFHGLENVVNFGLNENELKSWAPSLLNNVSIGTLDLSSNKFKCIDGNLDDIFRNLDFVNLWDNPWDDGCVKKIEDFTKRKEAAPKFRAYVPN